MFTSLITRAVYNSLTMSRDIWIIVSCIIIIISTALQISSTEKYFLMCSAYAFCEDVFIVVDKINVSSTVFKRFQLQNRAVVPHKIYIWLPLFFSLDAHSVCSGLITILVNIRILFLLMHSKDLLWLYAPPEFWLASYHRESASIWIFFAFALIIAWNTKFIKTLLANIKFVYHSTLIHKK